MNLIALTFLLIVVSVSAYWDVILDHCDVLEQNKQFLDWSGLKVRKINKTTRALSGSAVTVKELGDDTFFEGLIYRKMGMNFYFMKNIF